VVERAAGFWRRFLSAVIDGLVISVVAAIVGRFAGGLARELVSGLGSLAYFTWFHGSTGRTPGNAALGIRVVDFREGRVEPIGFGRAALRWLVSIPSALLILVGYLWMLWDRDRQTWHDKAAGSLPIRER
jgi:uncharacterized RDD family membrane protein YckC